jgi:hypothetical protein
VKIIVQWKEWIGLQFPKHATELLFDPVDAVKEISTIDPELSRAQFPVRSQKKVIPEEPVLVFA